MRGFFMPIFPTNWSDSTSNATNWSDSSVGAATNWEDDDPTAGSLLLESGNYLVTQAGERIIVLQ